MFYLRRSLPEITRKREKEAQNVRAITLYRQTKLKKGVERILQKKSHELNAFWRGNFKWSWGDTKRNQWSCSFQHCESWKSRERVDWKSILDWKNIADQLFFQQQSNYILCTINWTLVFAAIKLNFILHRHIDCFSPWYDPYELIKEIR